MNRPPGAWTPERDAAARRARYCTHCTRREAGIVVRGLRYELAGTGRHLLGETALLVREFVRALSGR